MKTETNTTPNPDELCEPIHRDPELQRDGTWAAGFGWQVGFQRDPRDHSVPRERCFVLVPKDYIMTRRETVKLLRLLADGLESGSGKLDDADMFFMPPALNAADYPRSAFKE